jgi:hypothetical protein
MTSHRLLNAQVDVLVSDPWEFGTACGTGPFPGAVVAASDSEFVIQLAQPVTFEGESITTIVARTRHVSDSPDMLFRGAMPANFILQSPAAKSDIGASKSRQNNGFAAIGMVTLRAQ